MKHYLYLVFVVFGLLSGHSLKGQIVVISDNFNRTGDLNGSAPSTPQTSNPTETWNVTSNGAFTMDSSGTLTSTGTEALDSGAAAANLAFSLTPGNVYTLSATLDPSSNGQWLAFGFQVGDNVSNNAPYLGGSPWILLKPDGTVSVFSGPDVNGASGHMTTPGSHTLSLVLDTTGSNWNYTAYIDGSAQSMPISFGSDSSFNPAIDHIFLESYDNTIGTISDFSLTTNAVPEPGTFGLLSLGFLALLAAPYCRRLLKLR